MKMTNPSKAYRLQIRGENNPKVATEAEKVTVSYFVKNIGENSFPGGELTIKNFSLAAGENTYVKEKLPIIKPIEPNSELLCGSSTLFPWASGYTMFNIVDATAVDKVPVQVYETNRNLCFPRTEDGAYVFHSVRAQSHEEKTDRKALWIAVISLAIVAVFQVLDWAIRFFYKI